jgi:YfiH family protein
MELAATVESVPALRSNLLVGLPGVRHAFFTRIGGVSTGIYGSLNAGLGSADDRAAVAENRRRMAAALGGSALLSCYQIHSADTVVATAPFAEPPRADAIVTATTGLAVAALVADCCPVLLADAEARVVGAAHAGWRGALSGILESAIAAMQKLGARAERTVAVLGPCIRQPSYEVGDEFMRTFTAAAAENRRFFAPGPGGKPHFDLAGYVAARLERAGMAAIDDLGLDTYADAERFYSYRRATHRGEPDYGRLAGAIVLE